MGIAGWEIHWCIQTTPYIGVRRSTMIYKLKNQNVEVTINIEELTVTLNKGAGQDLQHTLSQARYNDEFLQKTIDKLMEVGTFRIRSFSSIEELRLVWRIFKYCGYKPVHASI
jgi:hypothetical protein